MAKTKGFWVERVQIFDSLTKKAKDIRQETEGQGGTRGQIFIIDK